MDKESVMMSWVFVDFLNGHRICHRPATTYHQLTNKLVERLAQIIKTMQRQQHSDENEQRKWDVPVQKCIFANNNLIN